MPVVSAGEMLGALKEILGYLRAMDEAKRFGDEPTKTKRIQETVDSVSNLDESLDINDKSRDHEIGHGHTHQGQEGKPTPGTFGTVRVGC